MDIMAVLIGPLVGLLIVAIAFVLGICLSVRCCSWGYFQYGTADRLASSNHRMGFDSDISIISRDAGYFSHFMSPSDTSEISSSSRPRTRENHNIPQNKVNSGPAPKYEDPPSYEDCINKNTDIVGAKVETV